MTLWHWIRHLHVHQWYLRLSDGALECTVCHRTRP